MEKLGEKFVCRENFKNGEEEKQKYKKIRKESREQIKTIHPIPPSKSLSIEKKEGGEKEKHLNLNSTKQETEKSKKTQENRKKKTTKRKLILVTLIR